MPSTPILRWLFRLEKEKAALILKSSGLKTQQEDLLQQKRQLGLIYQ